MRGKGIRGEAGCQCVVACGVSDYDRRCIPCGNVQEVQCSHFYSRRYLAIRFDLRNCSAMCEGCNRRHNRDRRPYERYMRNAYDRVVISELDRLRMSLEKVTDEELLELLN
jgi:hypothetical protein